VVEPSEDSTFHLAVELIAWFHWPSPLLFQTFGFLTPQLASRSRYHSVSNRTENIRVSCDIFKDQKSPPFRRWLIVDWRSHFEVVRRNNSQITTHNGSRSSFPLVVFDFWVITHWVWKSCPFSSLESGHLLSHTFHSR
jgi:hypothetical protein